MFAFGFFLASIVLGVNVVLASPTMFPEVVPGPGLPSLESLGLTSKELWAMKPKSFNSSLEARSANFDNRCFTYSTADVGNTIACFNYLVAIGDQTCTVSGHTRLLCNVGDAAIEGVNLKPDVGPTSSSCFEAALAVQWIFTYCNVNGRVGGLAQVDENPNFVVGVYSINDV
ncbi:hypothetical protein CPB83DRAFT_911019 [Crepidotus variabilis]|uniref:Uncharacterized protein n=1 Tax=Crepidotus variabilis TaxID=179855 RepID=A0A9P6E5V4_9AGAR|nr:hypothetical protein CPB83DRAFT_911019 [Crepidotus variabilis]